MKICPRHPKIIISTFSAPNTFHSYDPHAFGAVGECGEGVLVG